MLRTFTLATRKLLVPRPLSVVVLTSDAASSSFTAIYDVRRKVRAADRNQSILPWVAPHNHLLDHKSFLITDVRRASGKKGFEVPDPSVIVCNMMSMLKCVDLAHLKDAPPPAFWAALAIGGTQVVIPFLELIGGYSQTLTLLQLNMAALTVAGLGGIQWGLAVSKKPSWETMTTTIALKAVVLLGLALPYPLGFLTVAGAVVSRLYLDLKSCAFPPWGNATRLFLTVTTLIGLFLGLSAYLLFHNRENEKKKDEKKEKKKGEAARQDGGEEEVEDGDKAKKQDGKNGKPDK